MKNIKLKGIKERTRYGRGFLISHEDVSESLLRSAELILGNQKNVYTYSLKRGEDIEIFGEKINEKIEELKNEKILILTDMFGGTPSNVIAANLKSMISSVFPE